MYAYREKDGDVIREYDLSANGWFQRKTEKALLEIVPTKELGTTLFLDGEMQLAYNDEYIYHESLVHPCLASAKSRKRVCIVGGGDGCALREVLKWPDVEHVDVLDWDKEMIDIFSTSYAFLNGWAYDDKRATVETKDIRSYRGEPRSYDCILVDLIDPDESQAELWLTLLDIVKSWISKDGSLVINAGGITASQTRTVNWLLQMVQATPFHRKHLYKVFVPSFGREWCFLLLNGANKITLTNLPSALRYMDDTAWHQAYTYGWTKNYIETLYGYQ
jgi:predicted membrane-bound spermidine synthase